MEQSLAAKPKLLLGLIGFSAERHQPLCEIIGETRGAVAWQLCGTGDADAWWANGQRALLQSDRTVRVPPAVPQERAVHLRLGELDRPLAFAEPVSIALPASVARFDERDPASVRSALARFESMLRLRAVQLCVAAQMVAHEEQLHAGFCHLVGAGRLLAVADRRGEVGTAPGVTAADLAHAVWSLPPLPRCDVPPGFDRVAIPVLMWQYAMRADGDLLPARYRSRPIHFRRMPRVPPQLQRESHRAVLRELENGPLAFDELEQRTGLDDWHLARNLAALYFTGAITTDPARASAGLHTRRTDRFGQSSMGAGFASSTSTTSSWESAREAVPG